MRKVKSLLIGVTLFITTLAILPEMPAALANGYGDYPPPSDVDWIISQDTYIGNETWVIEKNITVMSGATLTLQNVTLRMNSTTSTGANNRIEVLSGGTLIIGDGDGDNTTIEDASIITRNDPNYGFLFTAWGGSTLRIYNSIIEGCGRISSPLHVRGGIYVETDDAIIDHSRISNGTYYGIVLYGSDAVVSNNTIEWCDTGIRATAWSNGTIENNVIAWSNTYGIYVDGVDNVVRKSSNPLVVNNTITYTGRGTNTAVAIQIVAFCNPTIINTRIWDFTEDAIYFGQWCQPIVDNLIIDAQGGNYGLASSAPRNVTVTNCSIDNTNLWDLSLATAYFILTNTTFNQSKVIFQGMDSNLTVKWFLNTYVNDTLGNPIPNAIVRVRDNANGTYDMNFTTDDNGFVNWTRLTEYFQRDLNGDKDGDDPGERINYGPYNVTVSKIGYKTTYVDVNMDMNREIAVSLESDQDIAIIPLRPGWNLISTPLETADTSVEGVLSSISGSWDVVKYYHPVTKTWKSYRVGSTMNTLFSIDRTMGFWLHALEFCNLTVSGEIPASTSITLYAGWNLVGYPSMTEQTVANALWGTGANRVEVYQSETPYIREAESTYVMKPGEGYWVRVAADSIWTINW